MTGPPALVRWSGTLTALSSISHAGQTRGTVTMLRRELVVDPDGQRTPVPLVSGNAWRGRLRRIGEELLRDVLAYDRVLPLPALHALRGGGALAKTSGEPLSGARLARLRELIPQLGVFGAAASGRVIDGCLQVGKVWPIVAETAAIHRRPVTVSAFEATQIETYIRGDDSDRHDFPDMDEPVEPAGRDPQLMLYRVETFPVGTQFHAWLQLHRPTAVELAFFCEVLEVFGKDGRLGGRHGVGHGLVDVDLWPDPQPVDLADWRAVVTGQRDEAIAVLQELS